MRFQVLVNGSPVCTAGQSGFGILTTLLSWRKLDPTKIPLGKKAAHSSAPDGELEFSVGDIDSVDNRHTSWKVPAVGVGDEIYHSGSLASGKFDAPTVKFG